MSLSVYVFIASLCVCVCLPPSLFSACIPVSIRAMCVYVCVHLFACVCYITVKQPALLSLSLAILTSVSHWPQLGEIFILFPAPQHSLPSIFMKPAVVLQRETDLLRFLPRFSSLPCSESCVRFISLLLLSGQQ